MSISGSVLSNIFGRVEPVVRRATTTIPAVLNTMKAGARFPGDNTARNIDSALAGQNAAADKAAEYMQQNLDYLKTSNEPLIKMGDAQLEALRNGIESGAFSNDESLFNDYQQYIAPEYQPGGKYQYESRERLMTPERYQYSGQMPGALQAPAPVTIDRSGRPTLGPAQQFQYDQNAAPKFQAYQAQQGPDATYYDPTAQPFSLQDDLVLQSRIAEANKATEVSAAARGMQLSGANLQALQQNASRIAADEGAAAYGRYADQQNRQQNASNYQNSDQWNRFAQNRDFGQNANLQNYNAGRSGYTDDRNFAWDVNQGTNANDLARFGAQSNQYNADIANNLNVDNQNWNKQYQTWTGNTNQANVNRNYDAMQNQQNWENLFNTYGVNNANYNTDRGFDYGVNRDYQQDQFDALKYNTGNRKEENANQYGLLTDKYGRIAQNKQNQYGYIGDLVNIGTNARNNMANAMGGYYGGMSDLAIQRGNARASALSAKAANNNLFSWLGL